MAYLPGPKTWAANCQDSLKIQNYLSLLYSTRIKVLDCFPPPCTGKSGVVNWIIEDIVFSPKLEDPKLSERLSTTAVDICFNMLLLRKLVILRIIQYNQIIIQYQEAQL